MTVRPFRGRLVRSVDREWELRERELPDGTVQQWVERAKPGRPGTVERVYVPESTVERVSGGGGTCTVVRGPKRPASRTTAGTGELRVVLGEQARRAILDTVAWTSAVDGLEVAGLLYGSLAAAGSVLHVTEAMRSCKNRGSHRVELAGDWRLDAPAPIGDFHSQPGGDTLPSKQDLRTWRARAEDAITRGQPAWVSVIVGVDGFKDPQLAVFVSTGRDCIEQANF